MTAKKIDLAQIRNALGIIGTILFVIYFPINSRFSNFEREIIAIKKAHAIDIQNLKDVHDYEIENLKEMHKEDCNALHEKMKSFASLDVTNIKLEQVCKDLTRLFKELDECRAGDRELRETIQELIAKIPTN